MELIQGYIINYFRVFRYNKYISYRVFYSDLKMQTNYAQVTSTIKIEKMSFRFQFLLWESEFILPKWPTLMIIQELPIINGK